jgi:sugar phosphate isomerase/epimerase
MAKITAMSTLGWAHYTLYEAIPAIAARGFRRVDIASLGSYCFHFHYGSPTPPELKAMLEGYGLTPICLNYSEGIHYAYEPADAKLCIEKWERKLPHLAEVGIPMMIMVFGRRNDRPDREEQLAAAVRVFDRIAETAKGYGVRMLLEAPHLYQLHYTPEKLLWVLDRVQSDNIGVALDSSHWGVIQYDLEDYIGKLGNRLWHVHLRDSAGPDTNDFSQDLELTPGNGVVDFARLARALDNAGYTGDVITELEYRDITLDAIEREYNKGLKYLSGVGWKLPEGVMSANG